MSEPGKNGGDATFTSEDSLVVVFDGPGENIRRPRRPNNPIEWPPPRTNCETPRPDDGRAAPPSSGGDHR
jgi:hypothetical protein